MKAYTSRPEYKKHIKQLYQNDPRRSMIHHAKSRSKKLFIEFDLQYQDIIIPEICPILEIPIYVSKTGKPCGNSPTLDRVDNALGYTKNNVRVISHRANSLKRDNTLKTLKRLIQYIEGELPY